MKVFNSVMHLFFLLSTTFLAAIVWEEPIKGAVVYFILLLVWLSFLNSKLYNKPYAFESLSVSIWVPVGAWGCYFLNIYCGLGSIIAAGIIGTLASFLPVVNRQSSYLKKLPATIYCGAFVGMSSFEVAPNALFILAAGLLAGIFYMLSKEHLVGIGGKLGTIAFGGVAITSLIYWLVQ